MRMIKTLIGFMMGFCFVSGLAIAQESQRNNQMKILLGFDDKEIIIKMYDNPAAEQVISLLPASFDFIDYGGKEKIANFAQPLSLADAPHGMVAKAGKMFIYAPWGNMGFFYKDHGNSMDNNLIPLGEIESGLEYLLEQRGGFTARMEVIAEERN